MEFPQKFIVLSRGERQAKEFIADSVGPHCRAIGAVAQYVEGTIPGTSIQKQEVVFDNGSRIIALPANPATARSYEGDVLLDEFAFHQDAAEIYKAIGPSISRGFRVAIISTPNGQQGAYYDLSEAAGLVDGMPAAKDNGWSGHLTDIFQAIADGFKDRHGRIIEAAVLRADCLDEEMWLQEFCCQFISISSQWIPPKLFDDNVDTKMGDVSFELGVMPIQDFKGKDMYGGWDIARNKDLSVVWIWELVGDVLATRGVINISKTPTPQQKQEAKRLIPFLRRMVIDKSGMGLSIFEDLEQDHGPMVEGVQFTQATKEALAVGLKSHMEARKTRIPDVDLIRNSFRQVKKITTATGQSRFDAEHDSKLGHADFFWAAALAASGCARPMTLGLIEWYKLQQKEIDDNMKKKFEKPVESSLQKPMTNDQTPGCPNCQSMAISRMGPGHRCNQCGHQWGDKYNVGSQSTRRNLSK